MLRHQYQIALPIAGLLLLSATGCSIPQTDQAVAVGSPSPAAKLTKNSRQFKPDTRVIAMSTDGQMGEVRLRLLDQPSLPFTTYYPEKNFTSSVKSEDGATHVQFVFKPKSATKEKAFVEVVLPARPMSVEAVQDLILGDRGLLDQNDWQLSDRTNIVSFSWAKEKLIFQKQTEKITTTGAIYVGEQNGQAFYVVTSHLKGAGNSFEALSTLILESLQFRDQSNHPS